MIFNCRNEEGFVSLALKQREEKWQFTNQHVANCILRAEFSCISKETLYEIPESIIRDQGKL